MHVHDSWHVLMCVCMPLLVVFLSQVVSVVASVVVAQVALTSTSPRVISTIVVCLLVRLGTACVSD